MKKTISEHRVEEIIDSSLNLPIFIRNEQGDTVNAMYISNIGPVNSLGMPEYIQITKETLQGIITIGNYQLVESVKQIIQNPTMN
jgi:hypothetical protein